MFRKNRHKKISYSQSGEDLIIDFIMSSIGIDNPSYIDIGAHHPYYLSNTALFYSRGSSGVCIEPDPALFREIKKVRKNDICLNIGVGVNKETEADFFIMSVPTLNSMSKEEAIKYESYGSITIKNKIKIQLIGLNEVIEKYCQSTPNFISMDAEGVDYEILKTFNFEKYHPDVFCIETLTYTENNTEEKIACINELMLKNNYFAYADTYINTIFLDKIIWKNRRK